MSSPRLRPPPYDVAEPAAYVAADDTAWRADLPPEVAALRERYYLGETRIRLGSLAQHLDMGSAVVWRLRPLPPDAWYRVRACMMATLLDDQTARLAGYDAGALAAFRAGVVSVDGLPWLRWHAPGGVVSDETVAAILAVDPDTVLEVGYAAWRASQPVTESEVKT